MNLVNFRKPAHMQQKQKQKKKSRNPDSTISPNFICSLIIDYPKPPGTSMQFSTAVSSSFQF